MKQSLQILLVEDSQDDAELLIREMRRGGIEATLQRVDTAAAMSTALDERPWDIVISDYVIPGFGGPEALELFKRKRLHIPFIIVSGKIGEDIAVSAMKAGADDYVMKDHAERLIPAIERALREAALRREKRQSDEALRDSEERFRQLAENIGAVFFIFEQLGEESLGRVSYVSPAYEAVWASTRRSLQDDSQAWLKMIHPSDRKHIQEKLPQLQRGNFNEEFRILRHDMQTRWVHFRGFPVLNDRDQVHRIVGIAEDITDRKYAQEQLEANARQLHQMVEELQLAEEHLRASNDELFKAQEELERRVQERTAELRAANDELKRQMSERRRLENELLEIAENERRRIGFDLHDDLGQKLTGALLMVKGLENQLAAKHLPEAKEMHQIHALINEVVDHTHDLAHYFSSLDFQGEDLRALLKRLVLNVKTIFKISCRLQIKGEVASLPANVRTQLYKIAQESVSNAIKHGKATQVALSVLVSPTRAMLSIKNDGVPFPEMKNPNNRMGLRIMNYRASTMGAELQIKPNGSKGTMVSCHVPLKPNINGSRTDGIQLSPAIESSRIATSLTRTSVTLLTPG